MTAKLFIEDVNYFFIFTVPIEMCTIRDSARILKNTKANSSEALSAKPLYFTLTLQIYCLYSIFLNPLSPISAGG